MPIWRNIGLRVLISYLGYNDLFAFNFRFGVKFPTVSVDELLASEVIMKLSTVRQVASSESVFSRSTLYLLEATHNTVLGRSGQRVQKTNGRACRPFPFIIEKRAINIFS